MEKIPVFNMKNNVMDEKIAFNRWENYINEWEKLK